MLIVVCWLFQGRTNLPPEKVPWDAIKTLLSDCIYGGKIDNAFDQVSSVEHREIYAVKSSECVEALLCVVQLNKEYRCQ